MSPHLICDKMLIYFSKVLISIVRSKADEKSITNLTSHITLDYYICTHKKTNLLVPKVI